MAIGPTLETNRLILRPPAAQDFDGFCALMADEDAARHIGGQQTPPMVWRGLCTLTGSWVINGYSMWSVIEKSSGQWVGRLGPWQPEGWPGPEVGWGLLKSAWGKGFASEGASAAMDFAVNELGWTHIIHTIAPENAASIKLAERLGSKLEGESQMPPPFEAHTCLVYGQSADDWRAHKR